MFSFLIQTLLLSYLLYILLGGRHRHTRSDERQQSTRGDWQNGQGRSGDGWGNGGSWQNAWESYYRQNSQTGVTTPAQLPIAYSVCSKAQA